MASKPVIARDSNVPAAAAGESFLESNWKLILGVGTVAVAVGVYLLSKRGTIKPNPIEKTEKRGSKGKNSRKIDKQLLVRILNDVNEEMTSEYQSVRADMESQSMSEHEREAAFAALVTRVDGTVAEKHQVTEKAIQDACETFQEDEEISVLLEQLSKLHDEFMPDVINEADLQNTVVTDVDKQQLIAFVQESFARSIMMIQEAKEMQGESSSEEEFEEFMTQRGELAQAELLQKYNFTAQTLQLKMAKAQSDPLFSRQLQQLTMMMQQAAMGGQVL